MTIRAPKTIGHKRLCAPNSTGKIATSAPQRYETPTINAALKGPESSAILSVPLKNSLLAFCNRSTSRCEPDEANTPAAMEIEPATATAVPATKT